MKMGKIARQKTSGFPADGVFLKCIRITSILEEQIYAKPYPYNKTYCQQY